MLILFLYKVEDYGIFGDSKIRTLLSSPVLKNYEFVPISVGKIPPSKRFHVIKSWIDKADIVTIGQGTFAFMQRWARESGIYGFTRNLPMLSIDSGGINDAWSLESVAGPSPFVYLKWRRRGKDIDIYNSSYIFDQFWIKTGSVPLNSVSYRLEGKEGLFEEFAPTFGWVDENGPDNFPYWVDEALRLARKPH